MTERQIMTPKQASDYLGIAVQTLARWRLRGGGPLFHKLGSTVRYEIADLNAYLDKGRRASTAKTAKSEAQHESQ